ncbi:hypothetical protein MJ904_22285 [Massilia sp. MB5]|uniref:hypothetical protein n=1 Tax=Massilia sp. MB5 TaxID=2919578 RepID=UPI001F0DC58A|nr:hypothetical protein [Massilia sp. MB5]UMR29741.1 hypothetical protein MJ904_22285 [Massilia sp. MB5]
MKIMHHIGLAVEEAERQAFLAAGVELETGFAAFQIEESDARWPAVEALARRFGAVDTVSTKFSAAELKGAQHLALAPAWHHGYPEPSEDRGYLAATYDLSGYCEACGTGKRQVQPFRFAKAPVWGKNDVLQLNWVFDEYFVKPEVWSALFEPFGIACRPVLLQKSGGVLDSVVQLDVDAQAELDVSHLTGTPCSCCGRTKYPPPARGFHPRPETAPAAAFKSAQYFGSGASASRAFLVTQELYAKLAAANIKGVNFKPCAS